MFNESVMVTIKTAFKKAIRVECLLVCLILAAVCSLARTIFRPGIFITWDNPIFIARIWMYASGVLTQGRLMGWDPTNFFGYPTLFITSSFQQLLGAFLYLASGKALPLPLIYKIIVFASHSAVPLGIYAFMRAMRFNAMSALSAALLSLLTFNPQRLPWLGDIYQSLETGIPFQTLSVGFLFVSLALFYRLCTRPQGRWFFLVLTAFSISATLLLHPITAYLSVIFIPALYVYIRASRLNLARSGVFALPLVALCLGLTAFWLLPFVSVLLAKQYLFFEPASAVRVQDVFKNIFLTNLPGVITVLGVWGAYQTARANKRTFLLLALFVIIPELIYAYIKLGRVFSLNPPWALALSGGDTLRLVTYARHFFLIFAGVGFYRLFMIPFTGSEPDQLRRRLLIIAAALVGVGLLGHTVQALALRGVPGFFSLCRISLLGRDVVSAALASAAVLCFFSTVRISEERMRLVWRAFFSLMLVLFTAGNLKKPHDFITDRDSAAFAEVRGLAEYIRTSTPRDSAILIQSPSIHSSLNDRRVLPPSHVFMLYPMLAGRMVVCGGKNILFKSLPVVMTEHDGYSYGELFYTLERDPAVFAEMLGRLGIGSVVCYDQHLKTLLRQSRLFTEKFSGTYFSLFALSSASGRLAELVGAGGRCMTNKMDYHHFQFIVEGVDEPARLLFRQNYYPNWKAFVDHKAAAIVPYRPVEMFVHLSPAVAKLAPDFTPQDLTFMSVPLGKGTRVVDFIYQESPLERTGRRLSIIVFFGGVVFFVLYGIKKTMGVIMRHR